MRTVLAFVTALGLASCRVSTPDLDDFEFACEGAGECRDAGGGGDGGPSIDAGPDPDLLAHLPLDTIASNETPDVIGDHAASCTGTACPTPATGHHEGALAFDGANDGLALASGATLNPPFGTLAVWVYITAYPSAGAFMTIAGKPFGAAAENSYEIYFGDAGQLFVYAAPAQIETGATLAVARWTHVAATWTPTALSVFVDGALVDTTAASLKFDGNAVLLGFDRNSGSASDFLNGRLDDARIYERALTEPELAALAAR